ncbi:MAG: outer membrane lipoprotein-sorting protein [Desulfobacteraceae bacterium]|nr:outer membrane lipoprotein-sorting protein [Desulfobacteraceae bacterium]
MSTTVAAFIPQTPHLLFLITDKIKKPVGIVAFQTKKVLNYEDETAPLIEMEEKLSYSFPGKFRSDVISNGHTSFYVQSNFDILKVMDGTAVTAGKLPVESYTDILLHRDYESLRFILEQANVETTNIFLERTNDTICYVIGKPFEKGRPFPSLWIEKDTFFPVKYVLENNGWFVEFFYQDWQRVSKTWYPMKISIFLDNQLFALIDVRSFELNGNLSADLFDVERLARLYPNANSDAYDETREQVEDLNKSIEEFKQLYE